MADISAAIKRKKKFKITPYLFIAPHIILFIVFFLYPLGYGIFASFTKWNLFNQPEFIGLENYRLILFEKDSTFYRQFWNGLKNTVTFVIICVPFQIIIPLLIAQALNLKPKGHRFFQSTIYMPTLVSITAVTLTWMFIFNRTLGLFNNMLGTDINWYGEQPYAWMTVVIVTIWWIAGQNMIIYVAALEGIDKDILEAAQIDGVNMFQRFFRITLPSIRFQLVYTLVISIIQQFNIYGQPLMLTGGGPNETTFVLLMYIRNLAFGTGNSIAGVSTAMSMVLGLVICIVSIFQLILLRNREA